jgi:hypothetical protein
MGKHNKRQTHITKLADAKRKKLKKSVDASDVETKEDSSSEIESEVEIETESDWSSDNSEPWDDLNMDRNDYVAQAREWWEKAREVFQKNTIELKSRTFYTKDSKRTQRRHNKELKDAATESKKITDFFNIQSSNRDQSEILENNDESSDSDNFDEEDNIKNNDWKNLINSIEEALRKPDLTNDLKSRLMSIGMYFRHLDNGEKKIEASEIVAVSLGWTKNYKSRCIRTWAKQWIQNKILAESKRGKHPKLKSLWNHEDVAAQIGSHLRSNKFDITPRKLCEYVNNIILPSVGIENENKKISEQTAARWLKKLGWEFGTYKKGIYNDGHERPDVVKYRKEFLKFMEDEYEPYAPRFEGDDLDERVDPVLEEGVKMRHILAHDESTFYSNDSNSQGWMPVGEQPLKKKGKGRAYHVSDFLSETIGPLHLNDEQRNQFPHLPKQSRVCIETGTNNDGWWTTEKLKDQIINKAIPLFEATHPGCIALFAFDNATSHSAFAKDALVASKMNWDDGGKQPKMRDTVFNGAVQKMVHLNGEQKGMKTILIERGLYRDGLKKVCRDCIKKKLREQNTRIDCCGLKILELQPDFESQKGIIQEIIEERGHMVIFYPKFHCELNFIEMYWGAAKRYTRENCDYTWDGLKRTVNLALDSVPISSIRRYARRSFRYMDAYRKGLTLNAAEYAVKKYRSHRKIPNSVLHDLGSIIN